MTPQQYHAFVVRVCADGDAEVRRAYTDRNKIEGAIQGFYEARQTANPEDLKGLLASARKETQEAAERGRADPVRPLQHQEFYWWWRMRELQIEWVANCVSAVLYNNEEPVIITPTMRGWSKAAEILGVGP